MQGGGQGGEKNPERERVEDIEEKAQSLVQLSLSCQLSAERPEQESRLKQLLWRVSSGEAISPRRARAQHGDLSAVACLRHQAFSHWHPKATVRQERRGCQAHPCPQSRLCQGSKRSPPLPGSPWPALVSLRSPTPRGAQVQTLLKVLQVWKESSQGLD